MTVLTIGTFDLFHTGHVNLLAACRRLASPTGQVVVGINTDGFAEGFKRKPLMTSSERRAVVAACRYVDRALLNFDKGYGLIRAIKPQILVIGSDWAKKDYFKQIGMCEAELLDQGTQLVYVPYTSSISTTKLRERMKK